MKPLLKVEGLVVEARTKSGPSVPILRGVDLTIAPGEIVGVIGQSGSGKSTLGLALAGYARPGTGIVSGRVVFEGQDVLSLPPAERRLVRGRDIVFVPQSAAAAFNPSLTIDTQVAEGPLLRGRVTRRNAKQLTRQLYRAFGLPEPDRIGRRFPHQVSGGQLQRAAAAMAFAAEPKLIVFDEPTTSLDVTTQVGVLAGFRDRIRSQEIAALYISHDLAVVAQLADRIVVMQGGRVIDDGRNPTKVVHAQRTKAVEVSSPARTLGPEGGRKLLEIRNLSFRYHRSADRAVADLDLEVRRGEVVGLIGESGSGKSTLARLIAGLLKPEAGDARFCGQPLPKLVRQRCQALRRGIQIVFQSADVALNPRQTIGEALGRPLSKLRGLHGAGREEEISRLLELVELPPSMAGRLPGQLSGGQKQRINLARALAAEPSLVICDEVTSALDADLRQTIVELLRRLREQHGLAFLFVTHDLSTASGFADRIVVLHRGRIVEVGPTEQVLAHPLHPYTRELVRSVPQADPGWLDRALADRQPPKPSVAGGCGFWSRCPQGAVGFCDRQVPHLAAITPDHHVACHTACEVSSGPPVDGVASRSLQSSVS